MSEHDEQKKDRLRIGEAAELLRLSVRQVQRYCTDGRLPSHRTPGGQLRIKRKDLDPYL